ncbi:FecR family protein [Reyranella sp.]|uniref:FecR family protein n=1 Tax=Reyranella sp. TaxID=1929291 RepID=UPI003BAA9DA8
MDDSDLLRSEAVEWLVRINAAPQDSAARAGLEAWLASSEAHRRAYRSVERVWMLSGVLPLAAPSSSHGVVELSRVRRTRRAWGISAAAFAACVALWFFPTLRLHFEADHLTGVAELRELTLEDGSIVYLDAASAIAVRYDKGRREVELLAGQAFFKVVSARDRPFVVTAGNVAVTVKGTAFDVGSSRDGVSVAVQSGTVEVLVSGSERNVLSTLMRGERMVVDRQGAFTRSQVSPEDVASWREHRLVVDGATLGEVVDELGRHHRGVIVVSDRSLADRRITGVFDLRRPLEALHTVARTQHGSVLEISPYLTIVSSSKP